MSLWNVPPEWKGGTAVCIGGGPSLTSAQVDYCRGKARVLAINDAYRLAPWADMLYGCDDKWWSWHSEAAEFAGLKVTQGRNKRAPACVRRVDIDTRGKGLSRDPARIHGGKNSGYQAVNLAYLLGAARILLLGYDMRLVESRAHWFGDHPDRIRSNYENWITNFQTIAAQLPELGVEIINCTPGSALRCFPMRVLEEVI